MHSVIVIRNNEVIVQRENDCYTDTMANFLRDGGELPPLGMTSLDYDQTVGTCIINGEPFQQFPNAYADRMIERTKMLVDAFEARRIARMNAEDAARRAARSPAEIRREELQQEINRREDWLSDHDYIGIKIACGRATPEDYAEEIAKMNDYAADIKAMRKELAELKTKTA